MVSQLHAEMFARPKKADQAVSCTWSAAEMTKVLWFNLISKFFGESWLGMLELSRLSVNIW